VAEINGNATTAMLGAIKVMTARCDLTRVTGLLGGP